MDPSISIENEKIALELKYLLSLQDMVSDEQTLATLNQLYPFNQFPLTKVPPLQIMEYKAGNIICSNLRQLLKSYCLVIILGKCKAHKNIYFVEEQKFIDQSIKERLVYNFEEGETELVAVNNVTLLKIHNIWIKMAKQAQQNSIKAYIQKKLLKIPFFAALSFEEFNKICSVSKLHTIGPGQCLISECTTPYHMYVVTEGQLTLRKEVDFTQQSGAWKEVQINSQKRQERCQQLFQYLVRQPQQEDEKLKIIFSIKTVGEGVILCATQTLNQTPLPYSIISTLKSKYVSIKYPDFYVLEQSRLGDIRAWPTIQIDKKQLRRQYYYERNWQSYKSYLTQDQKLSQLQAQKFQDFLRKDEVNMSMKKYNYCSNKVGQGYITDSPAAMMNRFRQMTYQKR